MSYHLFTKLLTSSVLFGMIIGLWRYKKIPAAYKPLVWLLVGGFISEVISDAVMELGYSNFGIANIYCLFEAIVILWLFHRWETSTWLSRHIRTLLVITSCLWLLETFFISNMRSFNSYFLIIYCFVIVLFSVRQLNVTIWEERGNLLKNTKFLTGIAFLMYFTFSFIVELFWMYSLDKFPEFSRNIFHIFRIVNVIANLIFAFALLWTPTRPRFLLLSSSPSPS